MILPIYLYGSDVLHKPAMEVDIREEGLLDFVKSMQETMVHADGCGLAAPQVGRPARILVVDGYGLTEAYPELKGFHREMINPRFTFKSEETDTKGEGCLSIPNVDADVTRSVTIKVRYFDTELKEVEEEFTGFAARMIQHEMDHLDGIVFTDRASAIRKKMIASKLHNIAKGKCSTSYRVKTDKK